MTELVVKSREEWRDYWLKCYKNRNPDADVGPGSYPWVRASALAEVLTILSADALAVSDSIPLDNMTGSQLDAKYGSKLPRNLESKASGYITISTSSAGSTIYIGDLLTHPSTRNQYEVTSATNTYLNGTQLAVRSVDPGLGQNITPGEVLQWVSPRPGCYATAVVFAATDGQGIVGGRATESDDEYRERIRDFNASPIGHGNEGDVLALIEATREHGVPVEKGFVYPCILGDGTLCYGFTIRRDNYWESRLPSSLQITDVFDYVSGKLPGDFAITPASVATSGTYIELSVTLDPRYSQWADFAPWPVYVARGGGMFVINTATSASVFSIKTDDSDYTGVTSPVPGNTIAVYDAALGVFRRKKILTVAGAGPWSITCDTTTNQTDGTYTPVVGQAVSPWFDAINDCAEQAGRYVAAMGPSEIVDLGNMPADGTRMSRQPKPYPGQWDKTVTSDIAYRVKTNVAPIATCNLLSAGPPSPTPSTVSVLQILAISDLAFYKA
jgi:uncharacterized phage protein gp47/JayE